jgi:hypothetical protein
MLNKVASHYLSLCMQRSLKLPNGFICVSNGSIYTLVSVLPVPGASIVCNTNITSDNNAMWKDRHNYCRRTTATSVRWAKQGGKTSVHTS